MAQAADAPTEGESLSTDVPAHEGSEQLERLESERRREVPALLGTAEIPDPGDQTESEEPAVAVETQNPPTPAPPSDPPPVVEAAASATAGFDMALLESLQESRAATQAIAARIDTVAEKADALSQQVNKVSSDQAELTTEIQAATAQSGSKNTFLIAETSLLALLTLLVSAQMYMVVSLRNDQQHQAAAESAVLKNMTGLSKKMAAYGTNLTPTPGKPETQGHGTQEPAHTNPPPAHDRGGVSESLSPHDTPPLERLNKLRNGLAEKKLIRKENGDWFVYGKKSEENITDVEVIKALNQAYEKIGRSLTPPVPLPAHNALCILKADGKGSTQIVMTKDFLP